MLDARIETATPEPGTASGRLGPLTFPSLIHDLCEEKHTGVLTVRDEDHEKAVYLDAGRIVFARSDDMDDRLGALLVRRGMIRLRDLEEASEVSARTGRRLGGVLVEAQKIRPQDLVWGVREQVKEIVTSLFLWTRGAYEMAIGPLPSDEVITLKMSTGDVVLEGVKRIDSWTRIHLAVGGLDTRYRVGPRIEELGRSMSLSLDEWTLLSRCEGPVPLAHLCEATPMKDFDVCRLVWALTVAGMLSRID
jgi:hypothetical protein